jgi:hypothetical protein
VSRRHEGLRPYAAVIRRLWYVGRRAPRTIT